MMYVCEAATRQARPIDLFDLANKNIFDDLEKNEVSWLYHCL